MNDILDIAVEAARESGAERITALSVKVGELSGVVPDALTFAFEVVAAETIASGSTFNVESVPAKCKCCVCGDERASAWSTACPICGGKSIISQGYELLLSSIEVE